MRKGENIFKRKDGRWEARYIKGYELSGKAKYGFCYGKSYKEAKEKVSKCKAEIVVGRPVPRLTIGIGLAFSVTSGCVCEKVRSGNPLTLNTIPF